jgi:superfamily II DNA or RNA helicase
LVEQTAVDYKNVGLDTGVYYGDQKDIGNQHMICTWQSLNNLDKMGTVDDLNILDAFLDNVDCFICDEVHLAKADVLKRILTGPMAHLPIRWGLTGTIPEDEYSQLCLQISIGEVINHLTPRQLQEKGVLSECHVNIIQIQDKGSHGTYQQELKHLVTDHARMSFISDSIKNIAKSGNTLVLVDRLKAGEMLEEFIDGSIFLSGEDGNDVRREHYDKIANSDNEVIIATYGIASTGVNIPRIFNLVMIEPGKSYIKVIQSIGRGIRKAEDKDFVDIWDFTSSLKYSKRHLTKRKAFYRKVQYPFTVTKVNY